MGLWKAQTQSHAAEVNTMNINGLMVRLLLLAAACCWADQPSRAGPRNPPPVPEWAAMEEPSTAEWLRRLPGRYKLAGAITHHEYVEFDPTRDAAFVPGTEGLGGKLEGRAYFERPPCRSMASSTASLLPTRPGCNA
jgi:hypothetical protein